ERWKSKLGAKTSMLVYANEKVEDALRNAPQLSRDAALELATSLFPRDNLEPIGEGDLCYTFPPRNEVHVGCFPRFRSWRQRSLQSIIPPGCRRGLFPLGAPEQFTCMPCTALSIGLLSPNGSTGNLFDRLVCLR